MTEKTNPPNMIPIEKFATQLGITSDRAIALIRDGTYIGQIVQGQWYARADQSESRTKTNPQPKMEESKQVRESKDRGSGLACAILGFLFVCIGFYFLLISPSESHGFANLHRLTVGETFSIMGAVFLAAAIRPRI